MLVGTFTGFLVGGLAGGVLLVTRRGGRKTAIPFGPAMLAGALLALFVAGPVATWYLPRPTIRSLPEIRVSLVSR